MYIKVLCNNYIFKLAFERDKIDLLEKELEVLKKDIVTELE